jgi:hypothetical protein
MALALALTARVMEGAMALTRFEICIWRSSENTRRRRPYPKNRGSAILIEANAPLRLLHEGSHPTVTAGLHGYANQSPTAGFGCIYA